MQGAVEGPSEFAEGMAIGVRSVFSGVVGGAAGTVSRITGALGKGLASLTFDEKFQKKRRETIKRRHDGVPWQLSWASISAAEASRARNLFFITLLSEPFCVIHYF